MIRLQEPLCDICGQPTIADEICRRCTKVPPSIDKIRSSVLYTDPVTKFMRRFKYQDQFALAKPMGQMMAETIKSQPVLTPEILIPIPLHPHRQNERGYNQSYLLALEVSRLIGVPVLEKGLERTRETAVQAKLDFEERLKNVEDVFVVTTSDLTNKHIGLIDDVCTTGATLFSAAESLKSAGASRVTGLTFARALKI